MLWVIYMSEKKNKFGMSLQNKLLFYSALVLGGVFLGDHYKPLENVKEKFNYHNRVASETAPSDYMAWHVDRNINDEGTVDLYLSNDNTNLSYKINEDLSVNCPDCPECEEESFGTYVDSVLDDKLTYVREETSGVKDDFVSFTDNLSQNIKDLNENIKEYFSNDSSDTK